MNATDDFDEIATAIMGLQRALRRRSMEPAVIELSSWEDGQQLVRLMREQQDVIFELGMRQRGEAVNQVEIAGTLVRWPAMRRALRGGGFTII